MTCCGYAIMTGVLGGKRGWDKHGDEAQECLQLPGTNTIRSLISYKREAGKRTISSVVSCSVSYTWESVQLSQSEFRLLTELLGGRAVESLRNPHGSWHGVLLCTWKSLK